MEPEATAPPTRDERQRRIDHAEMLRAHRDSKQRRQEAHAKHRHVHSAPPITLK